MNVNATNSTFNIPAAGQLSSRQDTLDQLDFLEMLIAQMQNQDPLSPMDSQEYASQLAQFTSVQELGAIKAALNESIDMNLLMTQSINGNLAAALVGKVVRAQIDRIEFDGASGADLQFNLGQAATSIQINVTDADGNTIRTLSMSAHSAGDTAIYWDGRDNDGNLVPSGTYSYSVSAKNASGEAINATTYVQGVVSAVNYEGGRVSLTVNGYQLFLGDILSVMADVPPAGGNSALQG